MSRIFVLDTTSLSSKGLKRECAKQGRNSKFKNKCGHWGKSSEITLDRQRVKLGFGKKNGNEIFMNLKQEVCTVEPGGGLSKEGWQDQ